MKTENDVFYLLDPTSVREADGGEHEIVAGDGGFSMRIASHHTEVSK